MQKDSSIKICYSIKEFNAFNNNNLIIQFDMFASFGLQKKKMKKNCINSQQHRCWKMEFWANIHCVIKVQRIINPVGLIIGCSQMKPMDSEA